MPQRTRQKLIEAAKQRFYRDGFRNVGIDAILQDVGISKTAFYKHFESKDDLMVGVLEDVDGFLRSTLREMVREHGGRSARGQIAALLAVVEQVIEEDDFHGCIFVNAAMEFPLTHDPVHQSALRHKRALEDFVFELAERAGIDRPEAFAEEFCMIIEGLYVTRSVTGNPETIAIARRLAECLIERYLPQGRAEGEIVELQEASRSDASGKARKKRTRSAVPRDGSGPTRTP